MVKSGKVWQSVAKSGKELQSVAKKGYEWQSVAKSDKVHVLLVLLASPHILCD